MLVSVATPSRSVVTTGVLPFQLIARLGQYPPDPSRPCSLASGFSCTREAIIFTARSLVQYTVSGLTGSAMTRSPRSPFLNSSSVVPARFRYASGSSPSCGDGGSGRISRFRNMSTCPRPSADMSCSGLSNTACCIQRSNVRFPRFFRRWAFSAAFGPGPCAATSSDIGAEIRRSR